MSRDDGFPVMDVSTSWLQDEKFSRLAREYPAQHLWAVSGYVATMAASWRHGKRMRIGDSLPAWLRFDPDGVGALMAVRLLDRTGRIPLGPWREWFGKAVARREKGRERWRKWNQEQPKTRTTANGLQTVSKRLTSVRPSVRLYEKKKGSTRSLAMPAGEVEPRPVLSLVEPLEETA